MAYLALYRKYRPQTFDEVRGQDHIVTTLKNQLKAGRIGHAYLFCGTRGTGKTSIAKLFAKAVNCENPVDGSPCGNCPVCRAIDSQISMNVTELDAASNNSVDNIRDIIDSVKYSPTEGHYKVYIIDEVHMLSTSAFNALLKTLEEPPSYVIFILATTEVHKIPITILSRCQRYDFKRITTETIAGCLADLMKAEQIEYEEKALHYIARTGDGSMRDSQSLLDQCIAFYLGQKLTYDKVLEVLGSVDIDVFARLLRCILAQNVDGCMKILDEVMVAGRELGQFVADFAWYLRNLLIAATTDSPEDVLEFSKENMELIIHEAKNVPAETLIRYIRILSELSNRIRYATQKRLLIEIEMIKLARPEMQKDNEAILDRIRVLEDKAERGGFAMPAGAASEDSGEAASATPAVQQIDYEALERALPDDIREIALQWKRIVASVPEEIDKITGAMVLTMKPSERGGKLVLVCSSEIDCMSMTGALERGGETITRIALLRNLIAKVTGKLVDIECESSGGNNNTVVDISKLVKMKIDKID